MSFFVSMDRRRIVTILATLGLAFATGHLMQTVLAVDEDVSTLGHVPGVAPQVRSDETAPSLPAPPAATLIPFEPPEPTPRERVPDDPPLTEFEQEDARYPAFDAPCTVSGDARVLSGARLRVTLDAPCLAGLPVVLEQDGLRAAWRLDDTGWLAVDIPAMQVDVDLVADLGDEEFAWSLTVAGPVPARVAVIREAPGGLGLSGTAQAFGDGSGAVTEVAEDVADDPVIEAHVGLETCGRVLSGEAVTAGDEGVRFERVSVAMPDCAAIGEIVVLDGVFGRRQLASN